MDAAKWDERYAATELVWSAEPNRFVAEELTDLPPGRALDLAAGEGRNAIWLARRGWQVTAVDYSQVAIDKGRRLAGDVELRWECADATTWDEPASYDLVVMAYLQVPAADRRAAIRAAGTALRPGGTFFLVAHDSRNLADGVGGPQDPGVLYTAQDVLDDLAGLDFETLRADVVERPTDDGVALDALVRLVRR
jgi:SAM-dependent methyltransferase